MSSLQVLVFPNVEMATSAGRAYRRQSCWVMFPFRLLPVRAINATQEAANWIFASKTLCRELRALHDNVTSVSCLHQK